MATFSEIQIERRKTDTSLERRAPGHPKPLPKGTFRSLGLGLITGAADDDPSAIGTYASAGAAFGPSFLWTAPLTFPMMVAVVYLSSKLGQVAGEGLTAVIRRHYPRWLLALVVLGITVGNICEAGADIGGISAATNLLVPIPIVWLVVPATIIILSLQIFGTYELTRKVFRWLALALLAYIGSAVLAKPELWPVLRGTFLPTIHFNKDFLTTFVAVMGTTLSPYLYIWEADQQVSEDFSLGRRRLTDRMGTTTEELKHTLLDTSVGMLFSNVVMYFIILCTASTLFRVGHHDVNTAAEAAQALRPLAGNAAGLLFAMGVIGVGFLAVPVMTTGAAYDVSQSFGWRHGLHWKTREAKKFYGAMVVFTVIATCMNFFGINPIRALVYAGIVQGFTTPFLTLIVMLITNNRRIIGPWVNSRPMNVLGWLTTAAMFTATIALLLTLFK